MPDAMLIIFSIFSLVACILFTIGFMTDGRREELPQYLFLMFLCMICPVWFWAYVSCPAEYDSAEVNSRTENNIDYVIINEKFINLNEEYGRDFEEGSTIKLKKVKNKFYRGAFPAATGWKIDDDMDDPNDVNLN